MKPQQFELYLHESPGGPRIVVQRHDYCDHGDPLRSPTCVSITTDGTPHIPDVEATTLARAILAASGFGQLILPSPDWKEGQTSVDHFTGQRISVDGATVHASGKTMRWDEALSLASNLAAAAFTAKANEEAGPSEAEQEIARLVEEAEPDLRNCYAQDAPEAIAKALVAAGYVKVETTGGAARD